MSTLYLIALVGVGLAIVAITLESILSVSRKPSWAGPLARPRLAVVPTVDRREQDLPFVGPGRRQTDQAPEAAEVSSTRAA